MEATSAQHCALACRPSEHFSRRSAPHRATPLRKRAVEEVNTGPRHSRVPGAAIDGPQEAGGGGVCGNDRRTPPSPMRENLVQSLRTATPPCAVVQDAAVHHTDAHRYAADWLSTTDEVSDAAPAPVAPVEGAGV
jgi:hypothetical protein